MIGYGIYCIFFVGWLISIIDASENKKNNVALDYYPRIIPFVGMPFGAIMVPKLTDVNMNCHTFVIGNNDSCRGAEVSFFTACSKKSSAVFQGDQESDQLLLPQSPLFSLVKHRVFGQCKLDGPMVSLIANTMGKPPEELYGICVEDQVAAASFVRYLSQRVLLKDDGYSVGSEVHKPFSLIASTPAFEQALLDRVKKTREYKDNEVTDEFVSKVIDQSILAGERLAVSVRFNSAIKPISCGDAAPEDEEFGMCQFGKCDIAQSVADCKATLLRQMMLFRDKKK